ncbi:opioid growth factor receptor-like protein 1 isoform X1 [Hippocampus comes]|uniref:opioid growth factor receptor-like protein 1 isoform X1 n=1 Tax=Hippocampus comes TaxID=109280 RepID=UPI00094EE0A0|nr:PREDICTED: opioid growth factor receptor-like protein 1 isoform X1 [Hippocampus comes]
MGNLLGNWRFKEPSTVEECDSTWGSDSESDEPAAEDDSGISESVSPAESEWPPGNNGDLSPKLTDSPEFLPKMKRSFYAARDLYKYRHCYPNYKKSRQPNEYRNLRFYLNKIPLVPDGIYIEEILTRWRGDYDKLEHNHTYIQWLFPLREQGLNFYAHELTQDEIKEFQSTREAKRRFLAAYSLMLDFYGIKLLDKSGNVARSSKWQERFHHLNESQHNYLRITRILKSLGELGYEAFKAPLVRLFLEESLHRNTLPNMQHSILEYFVYTIRRPAARRHLLRYARQHYKPAHAFLWGPPPKRSKPKSGDVGASVGAGSSGIRAPAPTPEPQRRGGETSFIPASGCSGTLVSYHDATVCQDVDAESLNAYTPLGSSMDGPEGVFMMILERNNYSGAVPL